MSTYSDLVLSFVPGLYLRLGDASGHPQDSSGNAHHSIYETMDTYNQAGALTADSDGSIYFDGASDQFNIANHDDFEPDYNEDFTIVFWVKHSMSSAGKMMFDFMNVAVTKAPYRAYTQASGVIRFTRYESTHTSIVDTSVAVNNGQWHFAAFRKSGANLNGIVDLTWTSNVTDVTTASLKHSDSLQFGKNVDTSNWFQGYLDEFAYFNYALSAGQLAGLYNTGKNGAAGHGPIRPPIVNMSSYRLPRIMQ